MLFVSTFDLEPQTDNPGQLPNSSFSTALSLTGRPGPQCNDMKVKQLKPVSFYRGNWQKQSRTHPLGVGL